MCDSLAEWGQLGDSIGGFSNGVTMLFVAWATIFGIPNEIRRARKEHADDARADASKDIWRACSELFEDLRVLRIPAPLKGETDKQKENQPSSQKMSPTDKFKMENKVRLESLEKSSVQFKRATELTELYLDEKALVLMKEIWNAKEEYLYDFEKYAGSSDEMENHSGADRAQYNEQVYGSVPREKLDALRERARTMLRQRVLLDE